MSTMTPESKLAALVLRIREAVLLAQAARELEARTLEEMACMTLRDCEKTLQQMNSEGGLAGPLSI